MKRYTVLFAILLMATALMAQKPKQASESADQCIALDPEYSDGYMLKGLATIHQGNKKAGLELLAKARDMGNEQAQGLIDKYK